MEEQLKEINDKQLNYSQIILQYEKDLREWTKKEKEAERKRVVDARLDYYKWREREQENIAFATKNNTFYETTHFVQYMGNGKDPIIHRISLYKYINRRKANPQQQYEIELRENWELANE